MQQRTVIGLDIGGTSTRGLRADGPAAAPGPELVIGAEASGGSSNVQNVSRDQARQRLAAVLEELGAAELDPAAQRVDVVIGAGGVDTDDDARRLRQLVIEAAGTLAAAQFRIVHDTRLLLAAAGARVEVFDPLVDELPDADGLVVPGGFPEEHAADLAARDDLAVAVRRMVADGAAVHAECAGLLWLLESLGGHRMVTMSFAYCEYLVWMRLEIWS